MLVLPTEIQSLHGHATHRNPGNHTHSLHYYVGNWLHTKSLKNQQYYTNRQKQRRRNGGIFLLPNWLSKYPLQTMDASHHKHSLRICRSKLHIRTTQAGFRKQKDPIHQLKNVIMALEDAKLFHKDIYTLIVDFTSAFNTTDHDRMLWIMYDLDFPTDAIDAVKNFYENATTQVKLPSGVCTGQIPVERGTIQGDTLSPFLFLLYMEPLL